MALVKTAKGLCRIDPEMPRGAYIPPEELEEALGLSRDQPKYAFALMAMLKEFWRATCEIGDPKMACGEKNGIRVMTDSEASDYTDRGFWEGVLRAIALHERAEKAIRESELPPEQVPLHQERSIRRGALAGSMAGAAQAESRHQMQREATLNAFAGVPSFDPFGEQE